MSIGGDTPSSLIRQIVMVNAKERISLVLVCSVTLKFSELDCGDYFNVLILS